MLCPRLCVHILTASPRPPESDRTKNEFFFFLTLPSLLLRNTDPGVQHVCSCSLDFHTDQGVQHVCKSLTGSVSKHGPRSRNMCASFSRVCLEPTAMGRGLWYAGESTVVSTGGRAHNSPILCSTDQESDMCTSFLSRKFRYVHDGQPTVILGVSFRRKRKKATEKEKSANLQLSYFFADPMFFDFSSPVRFRL